MRARDPAVVLVGAIQQMLNPLPVRTEREDLFVERYNHLHAWALQITEHDHELAEDLLHDLFIQFSLNAPDPHTIKNLDGSHEV
jgi:hypothetical protein